MPNDQQALLTKSNAFLAKLELPEAHLNSLAKLLAMSEFASKQISQNPQYVSELYTEASLQQARTKQHYLNLIQSSAQQPQLQFMSALRKFRNKEMLRIAWRAIGSQIATETILEELSNLADACILTTLDHLMTQDKFSTQPLDKSGSPQKLYVVALGKLGGKELNFSSDIDIYFAYPEESQPSSAKALPASLYFKSLAKQLVQTLAEITKDGFVYRVDLRLRPQGHSGPMVMSFDALETYYQEQGRDWERYAMIKARIVNQDQQYSPKLNSIFRPFVYRRYVDFTVMEALRSLKLIIQREIRIKHLQEDVKRGPGGIREIEFICQSYQLIRGGREPSLQTTNIFDVLHTLECLQIIPTAQKQKLYNAYIFFRTLENAIQMQNDQQTHQLPTDPASMKQIWVALNFTSQATFHSELHQHKQNVSEIFSNMLQVKEINYQDDERVLETQLINLCRDKLGDVPSEDLLLSLGFLKPNEAYQRLTALLASRRYQKLTQIAKMRLEKFLPMLLISLQAHPDIDNLFFRLLSLLENVLKRSTYLALLTENPTTIQHLLKLYSISSWINQHVTEFPFLLENLLDEESLYQPLTEDELQEQLSQHLNAVQDIEQKIEQLKRFKLMQQLRVAAAFASNKLAPHQVSMHLSRTANVILKQVTQLAKQDSIKKYPDKQSTLDTFTIIAYGKLGSFELNMNSDLDLVFLHQCDSENEILITKLARKILYLLNSRSLGGILYTVDTRLRPSGSSGLLVSHIDAFEDYQCHKAWTWEHQALIKARTLSGSDLIRQRFEKIRQQVLCQKREKYKLAEDISQMRVKMKQEHKNRGDLTLKSQPYGLIDVEFVSQYIVLAFANHHPELTEVRSVYQVLLKAYQHKLLSKAAFDTILEYFDSINLKICQHELLIIQHQLEPLTPPANFKHQMEKWKLNFS